MILGLFFCILQYMVVSSQVSVQDPGGPVPINSAARFNCTVGGGLNVTWRVQTQDLPAIPDLQAITDRFRKILRARGIVQELDNSTRSSLIISGSAENNGTIVQCGGFSDEQGVVTES